MTIEQTVEHLRTRWSYIREALLHGTYRPQPVRRVEIPTVTGRLIQQALLQVLQPLIGPTFSEFSDGFRPGRSTHDAVLQAQWYAQDGFRVVVDVDLEKFFGRVNQYVLEIIIVSASAFIGFDYATTRSSRWRMACYSVHKPN